MSEPNDPGADRTDDRIPVDFVHPGQADPAEPSAPPAPRPPWWRRRIPLVSAGLAVVLIAGVIVVVRAVSGPAGPGDLPSPRVLAHDPVPAGRVFWTGPKNCGVTEKTIKDLAPSARINRDGTGLECDWSSHRTSKRGERALTASVELVHAGPGVANAPLSPNATTMDGTVSTFTNKVGSLRSATSALRGLGDEAVLSPEQQGILGRTATVVFRAGNAVVSASYRGSTETEDLGKDKTLKPRQIRDAALRAATDIGRSLGVPAAPAPIAAPQGIKPVALPGGLCTTVPKDLRDQLIGEDDDAGDDDEEKGEGGETDPLSGGDGAITAAHTTACTWSTNARTLLASVTSAGAGDPGTALRDVARDYLRRYYAQRDQQPISAHDARYFHALAGVGDQGFCSYLQEAATNAAATSGGGDSPAFCVIRVGAALVTTMYASKGDPEDDDYEQPLTAREAVNGAYAAALPVLRSVKH